MKFEQYTQDDYQVEAARTAGKFKALDDMIVFAAMEINAEAGEVANIVYKYVWQKHDLNHDGIIEELGDVLWGIAIMATAMDTSLTEIMQYNIRKLRKRYPDGFDSDRSRDRPPGP